MLCGPPTFLTFGGKSSSHKTENGVGKLRVRKNETCLILCERFLNSDFVDKLYKIISNRIYNILNFKMCKLYN